MKKLLLSALLLIGTGHLFAQSKKAFDGRIAHKQVIIGLRGGVNFNSFGSDIDKVWDGDPKKKSYTGWNIGIIFDCPILESFYFQPGIFYKTKGFRLAESNHAYDRKILGSASYMQFPLLFSYRYQIKKGMQVEFNLGPYIGSGMKGHVKDIHYSYLMPPDDPDPEVQGSQRVNRAAGLSPDHIGTEDPDVVERDFFGDDLESSFGIRRMDYGLVIGAGVTVNRFYIGFQYDMGLTNLRNEVCWSPNIKFRNGSATILVGFNLFRASNDDPRP